MAKKGFESVDEYVASLPEETQPVLERVRGALRKALPGAQEAISYQIGAFRQHERVVIFFAGWKEHVSLYPATPGVMAALGEELAPYKVTKGTIRFPLSGRLPVGLVARIAKVRLREVVEAKAKPKRPKKKKAR